MHTLSMAYIRPPVHRSLAISIGFLIAATPSKTGDRKLRKCEKIMIPENKNIFDNNLALSAGPFVISELSFRISRMPPRRSIRSAKSNTAPTIKQT